MRYALLALSLASAAPSSGCRQSPGEGEPCARELSDDGWSPVGYVDCADGLECDRTLCLRPDGPDAPRRFGEFVALYDFSVPEHPDRVFERAGAGFPFLVLDDHRVVVGGVFVTVIDSAARSNRVIVEDMPGEFDALARTEDELWALGRGIVGVGSTLPDFSRIRTGYHPGLPHGYLLAGNEDGDLAWIASEGTAIGRSALLLDDARETEADELSVGPATHLVVEPGGLLLVLAGGRLESPNGRTVAPDHEALSGIARPYGGPTLGWIDANDATTPTRVVRVEPDGTLLPVLTMPIELDTVLEVDANAGRLYAATPWGLFMTSEPVPALLP